MADEITVLKDKMVRVLREYEAASGGAERKAERQSEIEAQRAEGRAKLPPLEAREAELWNSLAVAVDEVAGIISQLDEVGQEMRRCYGGPKYNVHNRLRHAVKLEQEQRVLRARAGQGHNREAARKARADELRRVAKEQKRAAKRMERGKYQGEERAKATEDAVDRLEGRTPKPEPRNDMFIPPEVALRGR